MIYLDHNSTTYVIKEVKDVVFSNINEPLNASSIHSFGRNARKLLEEARERLANALRIKLGREGYKIIFTSGGTEANNLIINNFKDKIVLYSSIEHASVQKTVQNLENSIELKVGRNGVVDLGFLREQLRQLGSVKALVSIMMANNETGVIQPVKEVISLAREYGAFVHTDAVQAFGKIKLDIQDLDVDTVSITAHKIGGLHGIGALVVKDNISMSPCFFGGGQERGGRPGTENVLAALCFAVAAERASDNLNAFTSKVYSLREYVEQEVKKSGFGSIIAEDSPRLPNTVLIASNNLASNLQLIQLDLMGIAVSSGSACSSGKVKNSQVLKAMGFGEDIYEKVIRVSFGATNIRSDAEKFISAWKEIHTKIMKVS